MTQSVESVCRDLTPWIFHHARARIGYLTPAWDADDLAQIAYLAICETYPTWRKMMIPWGWLRTVIVRRWVDEMRWPRLDCVADGTLAIERTQATTLDPGTVVERADLLDRASVGLTAREVDCITRYYLHGETQHSIAQGYGLRDSRICQILSGARGRMRRSLALGDLSQ